MGVIKSECDEIHDPDGKSHGAYNQIYAEWQREENTEWANCSHALKQKVMRDEYRKRAGTKKRMIDSGLKYLSLYTDGAMEQLQDDYL